MQNFHCGNQYILDSIPRTTTATTTVLHDSKYPMRVTKEKKLLKLAKRNRLTENNFTMVCLFTFTLDYLQSVFLSNFSVEILSWSPKKKTMDREGLGRDGRRTR